MGDKQKQVRRELSGWGNYPKAECAFYRPENMPDLAVTLQQHEGSVIARGLGRAYGDAALNEAGVVSTERLDRFLTFDEEKGVLKAQAGLELQQVLDVVIPHGWMMPVIPGTKHVSLGAMVACDVHGKNHAKRGTIGQHVLEITLRTAADEVVTCSPKTQKELFFATLGGMGLTGVIWILGLD